MVNLILSQKSKINLLAILFISNYFTDTLDTTWIHIFTSSHEIIKFIHCGDIENCYAVSFVANLHYKVVVSVRIDQLFFVDFDNILIFRIACDFQDLFLDIDSYLQLFLADLLSILSPSYLFPLEDFTNISILLGALFIAEFPLLHSCVRYFISIH